VSKLWYPERTIDHGGRLYSSECPGSRWHFYIITFPFYILCVFSTQGVSSVNKNSDMKRRENRWHVRARNKVFSAKFWAPEVVDCFSRLPLPAIALGILYMYIGNGNGLAAQAEVQSIIIYNDQDTSGHSIPLRLEVGSWVTLKLASTGPWARDSRR